MKKCKICNIEQPFINFDLASKISTKRDNRCKECFKRIKREQRQEKSNQLDKLRYELNNKLYGYSLKYCETHGKLSYKNIRLRIRYVKGNMQTNLSCIPCIRKINKLQRGDHILKERENIHYLICTICKKTLTKENFPLHSLKDKYPKCKICSSYCSKKSFVLNKYKLNEDEHIKLINKQNNLCMICGQKETSRFKGKIKRLAIDHCHKKESIGIIKIRGLLCASCNVGLGAFKDSILLLNKAMKYLSESDGT